MVFASANPVESAWSLRSCGVTVTTMAVPGDTESRLSSRVVWFLLAALPAAALITAGRLTPDPAGHGTHTQLGLPPCAFRAITGYPCPACGLTTAFAHMADLDVFAAAHANPFGIPLFLVMCVSLPIALRGLVRGDSVKDTLDAHHADKVVVVLAASCVLVWIIRAAAHFVE